MNKRKITIIIFIISFVILLIGFGSIELYLKRASKPVTLIDSISTPQEVDENGTYMTILIAKDWIEPQLKVGAQFDGEFFNHLNVPVSDWTITLQVPPGSTIDSSWNGNYTLDHTGTIVITPMDYNQIVPPGDSFTFGFVLHAPLLSYITEGTMVASIEVRHKDLFAFWLFIVAFSIWLIALIIQLTVHFRTAKFIKRQERDEAIILQSMNTFVNFIDAKDPYTKGHSKRVATYAREIARRMNLSKEEQKTLYYVALMHDVGKISTPDAVLLKPGRLSAEERKIIEAHTTAGGIMLHEFSAIPGIVEGALYHHERFDGHGYPKGLVGTEIPLFARIIGVADAYDAMSSDRCYRNKLNRDDILLELIENSGKQFDPDIVCHMIDILNASRKNDSLSDFNLDS